MKGKHFRWAALLGVGILIWWHWIRLPEPTLLSLRIDQPYDEVVKESSYPVSPLGDPRNQDGTGFIYVTEPSVILRFNDPKYGFELPPTKFVAVLFIEGKVDQFQTSPMLEPLPYDEAMDLMAKLQEQFKARGWQPWPENGSKWFDFSPAGRKRLYEKFPRMMWAESATLIIPGVYGMSFRIKCVKACREPNETPLFLIDIGMATDFYTAD